MKFNTKTRYGIRAITEIGKADSAQGIFQKDIATNQNISLKYLDHIINALKVAGLITNVKGKKSGYRLTRNPEDITMYDVLTAFEPGIHVIDCMSDCYTCEREAICAAKDFWGELNHLITGHFKSTTLDSLIKKELSLTS